MYSKEQIVEVNAIRITSYGVFCELEKDIVGLIHISEISDFFVKNIEDYIKVGDKIKVQILDIKHDKNQFCLSYKSIRPELLNSN